MKLHNTASTVTSAVTLLIVALIIVPFSSIINANANANVANVVNAQQTTTDEDEQLLAMAMSMSMSMSMLNKQIDEDEIDESEQTQTDDQQQTPQTTLNQVQVGNNVFIEDLIPNPNRIMDLSFGYWCSDAAFDCAFRMFTDLAGELVMVDSVSTHIYIYILIILILIIQYLYYLFVV
jgi:hypothetical protein